MITGEGGLQGGGSGEGEQCSVQSVQLQLLMYEALYGSVLILTELEW